MNRAEIRDLVIENTGRDSSADTTRINNAINAALRKVSSERLWNDLATEATATLVVDQSYIALASNVRRLAEVRVMDGLSSYKLILRPKSFLVARWPDFDSQASNKPRFGYLEGTTLHLVPPPNSAYSIEYTYYALHANFVGEDTDVVITHADEAVVAYATYRVFKSLQQHEDAAHWLVDYQMCLADAKKADRSSAVEQAATPRGTGSPVPEDYYLNPFIKETP